MRLNLASRLWALPLVYCSAAWVLTPVEIDLFTEGFVKRWTAEDLRREAYGPGCTMVLVGATWDGHFKRLTGMGYWQRLATAVEGDGDISVGVMLYNLEPLPWLANASDGRGVWSKAIGSYDVQVFGSGGALREGGAVHRESWWRWRDSRMSNEDLLNDARSTCYDS